MSSDGEKSVAVSGASDFLSRISDSEVNMKVTDSPIYCSVASNVCEATTSDSCAVSHERLTIQSEKPSPPLNVSLDREVHLTKPATEVSLLNDSLFLNFDPLLKDTSTSRSYSSTLSHSKSILISPTNHNESSCFNQVGHLISPLMQESLNTPSQNLLTQVEQRPITSCPFSPWLHHSILGQALGGGGESPEWASSIAVDHSNDEPQSSDCLNVSQKLDKPPNESMEYIHRLKHDRTAHSCCGSADMSELDLLASLLGKVTVNDMAKEATKAEDKSRILDRENIKKISDEFDTQGIGVTIPKMPSIPTSPSAPLKVTDGMLFTPVHGPSSVPYTAITQRSASPWSLEKLLNAESGDNMRSIIPPSSTHKERGLSGLLSMAARSVYDRLSGSGLLSRFQSVNSPTVNQVTEHSNCLIESTDKDVSQKKDIQLNPLSDDRHETGAPELLAPRDQCSVDDETWQSTHSILEGDNSLVVETSDQVILRDGVLKQTQQVDTATPIVIATANDKGIINPKDVIFDYDDVNANDKENIDYSQLNQLNSKQSLSPNSELRANRSRSSLKNPNILSELFMNDHSAINEEHNLPQISLSTDSSGHLMCENIQNILEEEVHTLRESADKMKLLLQDYEMCLLNAESNTRDLYLDTTKRLMDLARERDETIDQTSRMFQAYEDMLRRVQKSQESTQIESKRQLTLLDTFRKLETRYVALIERVNQFYHQSETQLTDALLKQETQREIQTKSLDKLQFESRQLEMRITFLKEQIRQKDQEHQELKQIGDQLFQSTVHG